jgi:hypothetical protein
MNYQTMKMLCAKRSLVFSNNSTGGGDATTDAATVDPNQYLEPIIGGSKTFNVVLLVSVLVAVCLLAFLTYKQLKK